MKKTVTSGENFMKKLRNLKALVSEVVLPDESTINLDAMPNKERLKTQHQIYQNICSCLGRYYSSHSDEWTLFQEKISCEFHIDEIKKS